MPCSPVTHPVVITQRFHARPEVYGRSGHTGIDIRSPLNDVWVTCAPGFLHLRTDEKVVTVKGTKKKTLTGYGAAWELDWNLTGGQIIKFIYGHGKDRNKGLDSKNVREGLRIAKSGNTGWSDAPHLHFEMRLYRRGKVGYVTLDPEKEFLKKFKIPYRYA